MLISRPPRRGSRLVTDFDASVNTVRAVASALRGEGHGGLSVGPSSRLLADTVSSLPHRLRALMYRGAGLSQGVPLDKVRGIDVDVIDEWACRQYGPGPYPAVVIGSTSGAAVHLAAALGAPFLPQTTLVSLRDLATDVDDPTGAMTTLAPLMTRIAADNPRVTVHHAHDPAQDRAMLGVMAYARLKRRALGPVHERFLTERLAPGGTILIVENTRTWRVRAVGERTYFQFGSLGGVPEDEYFDGSDRVTEFLAREGAPVRGWTPPEMDDRRPDAEWGFDPALGEDIDRFADARDLTVRRLRSEEPQQQSPFCADLYRWWYSRTGRPTDRLVVEAYAQWDPFWILRTGSVPFWLRFNTELDYADLAGYLKHSEPFDHIHANFFSHGVGSPGVVGIPRWEELIEHHAGKRGEVIGVDAGAYPLDTGSSIRYERAFRAIPRRTAVPPPLTVDDIDRFLGETGRTYSEVDWL